MSTERDIRKLTRALRREQSKLTAIKGYLTQTGGDPYTAAARKALHKYEETQAKQQAGVQEHMKGLIHYLDDAIISSKDTVPAARARFAKAKIRQQMAKLR